MKRYAKVKYSLVCRIGSIILAIAYAYIFFHVNISNSYMLFKIGIGFFLMPVILIQTWFVNIVIHEKGVDALIGVVGYGMNYHGYLIRQFKWEDVKIVFDHKYLIKFVNTKKQKILIRQAMMDFKHAIPFIKEYGIKNLNAHEKLAFETELEKREKYRNFSSSWGMGYLNAKKRRKSIG